VTPLKEPGENGASRSLRGRMKEHRENPVCASCHARMDPLGFALENFDALGKWRQVADGEPVDASASLPDGTGFDGISGLRRVLLSQKDDYVRAFSAKLLGYAIGRGIEYYDQPAIRRIAREAEAARWSSLILGVVRSTPFTMGRAGG
jgi:hypothetical protein